MNDRLVDGQQVNLATVEQLLSTYTSSTAKVKLTLQRPVLPPPPSGTSPLKFTLDSSSSGQEEVSAITNMTDQDDDGSDNSNCPPSTLFVSTPPRLARLLLGDDEDVDASREVKSFLRRMPYLVLGVTREGVSESSPEMADVLYQFPDRSAGPLSEAILKARGIFVTLCQVSVKKYRLRQHIFIVTYVLSDDA